MARKSLPVSGCVHVWMCVARVNARSVQFGPVDPASVMGACVSRGSTRVQFSSDPASVMEVVCVCVCMSHGPTRVTVQFSSVQVARRMLWCVCVCV